MNKKPNIDQNWTLFLDRDGVINVGKQTGYTLSASEFLFYPDAIEALKILRKKFYKMVVVTNQRCVGRGLLSVDDLEGIHDFMNEKIEAAGSKIDRVYYSIDLDNAAPNRKPNTGMAMLAKKDFPEIRFSKSIMVGNKLSDMEFGRNAGMFTVFLATTDPETPMPHELIDARYDSLMEFAKSL